jgi:hypothetical protein
MRPSRPSPAIIVAVLALVAALAGTAVAGPDANTSALNKKKVKKLVRKEVAKQIADAEGPPGPRGPEGQRGPAGSPAASVIQGSTGEPLATSEFSIDYFPPSGFTPLGTNVPAASASQLTPNAAIRVRDLAVRVAAAPGPDAERAFALLNVDSSLALLTCKVVNVATTCDSGNKSATVAPKTRYRMFTVTEEPAPAPSQGAAWSFRVVAP